MVADGRLAAVSVALLVALMWGLQPVLHKGILQHTSPQVVFAVGFGFYSLCMLGFVGYNWATLHEGIGQLSWQVVALIGVTSMTTAFLANLLYLYVLKDHKSYVVSALIYSSPFFTLLIVLALGRERVGWQGGLGVLLIVAGILVLSEGG